MYLELEGRDPNCWPGILGLAAATVLPWPSSCNISSALSPPQTHPPPHLMHISKGIYSL